MSTTTKVLVIGLDAAEPELLMKWCDSGDLPTLAKLRDQGVCGHLDTFPGLGDDAVWASFSTGNHPGNHGRYHHVQIDPTTGEKIYLKDEFLKVDPFWKQISDAGKRVAVVDVPKSPFVKDLNGIQIADWRVHGHDDKTRSSPAELAANVLERYGEDENDLFVEGKFLCSLHSMDREKEDRLFTQLVTSIEQKTRFMEDQLADGPWDLFLGVFKESHCAGHQFWGPSVESVSDDIDQSGPTDDRLKQIYVSLDRSIGRLLEKVDETTQVLVFTDLGMGSNITGEHLLESILLRLESNPLHRLSERYLTKIQRKDRLGRLARRIERRIQKSRTAVQVPHNEISGAIKVTCDRREYDRICDRLERRLLELRDPLTKKPLVEKVIHAKRTYSGSNHDYLPDLLVVWNRDSAISGACSPKIGRIELADPLFRPGNHKPGGFLFSKTSAAFEEVSISRSTIVDLAPTIATLLGIDLKGVSGKPIQTLGDNSQD